MDEEAIKPGRTPEGAGPEFSSADDAREQLLRMKADFENTKKRLERDKQDAIRFANERLLIEILHFADNFDRAMGSLSEGHDPARVKEGLKLAQDELHRVLEQHGLKPVESVGAGFDPNVHEAIASVERDDLEEGTVVDEVQKGYLLHGRLIRPSRVRVSQKRIEG